MNRGALAERFVGLELQKRSSPFDQGELYYWHRESRASTAEVDYVVAHEGRILPIEVKFGTRGAMRSLRLMMEEKNLPCAIRASQENRAAYDKIQVLPLYLIAEFSRLLADAEV